MKKTSLAPLVSTLALSLSTLAAAAATGDQSWTFAAKAGGRLEIDLETGGSIAVRGGDVAAVSITAEMSGEMAENLKLEAVETANGVRLTSDRSRRRWGRDSGDLEIVVTVPRRYDVKVNSMGGEIDLRDLEGAFSGETMGGGIELVGVRGSAALKTMGGSVTVRESTLEGWVETMGGDINFRDVRGGLRGKTMGGKVSVEDSDATATSNSEPQTGDREDRGGRDRVVELESMGGDVRVAKAPRGARVSTMGGAIRIESAREFVEAETMGGDIRIAEVDGRVEASTMGGDVEVTVVGAGGPVELESMSGEVVLTLPAGFSGDFDVEIAYTKRSRGNFEIRSDFPLTQTRTTEWEYDGRGSKRFHSDDHDDNEARKYIRGTGKNGSGTHRVTLSTINGNVTIRRAG